MIPGDSRACSRFSLASPLRSTYPLAIRSLVYNSAVVRRVIEMRLTRVEKSVALAKIALPRIQQSQFLSVLGRD